MIELKGTFSIRRFLANAPQPYRWEKPLRETTGEGVMYYSQQSLFGSIPL